jgi:uncharacterized membrane protein YoaK (UPF0700 family)
MDQIIRMDKIIRMDNKLYIRVRSLFIAVLAISIATLGVAAAVGGNATVWVRGAIVTAIAAILIALARRAYRGNRRAYIRMRLMTTIAPVAVAVIVALPHDGFPEWVKAEQVVVGLLLAAAAVTLARASVRRAYPRTAQG